MGVIKADRVPLTTASFSMRDIEEHARGIVLRAREEADQILATARAEGEVLRTQAHAHGMEQGRADGLERGRETGAAAGREAALAENRQKLLSLIDALSTAVQQLEHSRRELESQALSEVIALAVNIARRVTKLSGSFDPTVLTGNMSAAMKMAVHAADVRIAVNPAQKQTLVEALPELKLTWPNLEHVELIDDDTVLPGGCRVHTRGGTIDADLDTQLNRIAAELLPTRFPGQPA
jgi:flagellar assembly protein FliH